MSGVNGAARPEERRLMGERRSATATAPAEERRKGPDRRQEVSQAWAGGPPIEGPDAPTPVVAFQPEGVDPASARGPAAWAGDPIRSGRESRDEHDAIPSLAAVAGHPIHPLIVPFPIATLGLTVLTDLAYAVARDRFWARAGRLLTTVGVVSGAGAAGVGAVDFLGRSRIRDHRAAWLHAGGNVAALALSGASLALRLRRRSRPVPGPLLLSSLAGVILLVTGWLGGELSYRHRIGVTTGRGRE